MEYYEQNFSDHPFDTNGSEGNFTTGLASGL